MHPIRSSVAVLATLALALGALSPVVVAQEDAAEHPIVGAWVLDATPDDPSDPVDLFVVNPGGTLVSASVQGPGAGSWEPTGDRTADVTFHGLAFTPDGGFGGLVTVRASGEVAEDGQTFTATYTVEPPAAMVQMLGVPEGQLGPGEVTAQRISVEPMGETVGPIPEFPELQPPPEDMPPEPDGVGTVGVTLQEWAVIPESMTLPAGSLTFEVENIGPADPHELVVVRTDIPASDLPTREDGGFDEDAEGVEVIGEIEEFPPGTTETGTFDLEPGHYVFLCNLVEEEEGELEAHYQLGMWVDVEVS